MICHYFRFIVTLNKKNLHILQTNPQTDNKVILASALFTHDSLHEEQNHEDYLSARHHCIQ